MPMGEGEAGAPPKRDIPAFATEAEEANWWHKNRSIHGRQLLAAVKAGDAQVLTTAKLQKRIAAANETPSRSIPSLDRKRD